MNAMLASEISFPELTKQVSELNEKLWYHVQMFSDMLYKVAEKMAPIVMVKIGRKVVMLAKDTILNFGYDTMEKLGKDVSVSLMGIVRKVKLNKISKTISYSPKKRTKSLNYPATRSCSRADEGSGDERARSKQENKEERKKKDEKKKNTLTF